MQTYLLPEEMTELSAVRKKYVNDKELTPFKKWLKKNGKELTIDDKKNIAATWDIIWDHYTQKIFYKPNYENLTERFRSSTHPMNANSVILEVLERVTPDLYAQWQYVNSLRLNECKSTLSVNINNYLRKFCSVDFEFDYAGIILNPDFDLTQYGADQLDSNVAKQSNSIFGVFDKMFAEYMKPLNTNERRIFKKNFPYLLNFYFEHPATDTTGKEYRDRINYINALANEL